MPISITAAMRLRFALLIAALGLFLAILQPANGEAASNSQHHQTNAAQGSNQPHAASQPTVLTIKQADIDRLANAIKAANAKQQTAQEKQDNADNIQAQKDMATAAKKMFWVGVTESTLTLIGIVLVGFTLFATRRAAIAAENAVMETRRVGEAQVRAYLTCVGGRFEILDKPRMVFIVPEFRNTGASPAMNIMVEGRTSTVIEMETGEEDIVISGPSDDTALDIASGQTGDCQIIFGVLEDDAIMGFVGLKQSWDFNGICTWEDVFGRHNSIKFTLISNDDEVELLEIGSAKKFGGTMRPGRHEED